jgi:hypothetical protein
MGFFALHTMGMGMNVFVMPLLPTLPVLLTVSHLNSFSTCVGRERFRENPTLNSLKLSIDNIVSVNVRALYAALLSPY